MRIFAFYFAKNPASECVQEKLGILREDWEGMKDRGNGELREE